MEQLNSILSSITNLTLLALNDLDDVEIISVFASTVDRLSLCWSMKFKKKNRNLGVPRTEPWGTPARIFFLKPNSKHRCPALHLMVKMVNSDVLFDTGKQLFLYETMVNLTISVPITKGWHSRLLNVLSGCKRWPAELALSRPSLPPSLAPPLPFDSVCVCMWHTPYSLRWFDTHDLLWI